MAETAQQKAEREAIEKAEADQRKAERESRAVDRRKVSMTAGVDKGGRRITEDGTGQGLTVQSEWDKMFKNTASNAFGAGGKVNESYVGMPTRTPKLAGMLAGNKDAPAQMPTVPRLGGVTDEFKLPQPEPAFAKVNDDGLPNPVTDALLGPFMNSAQKFDLDGDNIFKGIRTARRTPLVAPRKPQLATSGLSSYYSF